MAILIMHVIIPQANERGGGFFYKTSLPLKIRDDLSFQECIVTELRFGHKKIFFIVLYRNPFYKSDTPEFMNFITELELLVSKIKLEKPYVMLFAGDFNAHSKSWYADGDTNSEGIQLDTLFSDLGSSQLISEPTHTRDNCNPTCIDLTLTDQPNLIMETGVRPSLDPSCKYQITFCKLNFKIPPLRPFTRHTWQFDKAERVLIERSMSEFQWESVLTQNTDPDSQVDILNSTLLNIMSNFVPNFKVNVKPDAPKWITRKQII